MCGMSVRGMQRDAAVRCVESREVVIKRLQGLSVILYYIYCAMLLIPGFR
jgi:hypothetical protein